MRERREPSASGERALQAGGAERSGTPLAAAVYGRAGGVFAKAILGYASAIQTSLIAFGLHKNCCEV